RWMLHPALRRHAGRSPACQGGQARLVTTGNCEHYVNPRKSPDFAWAFASRLMFVLAYAFLVTYQAYYLLEKIGSTEAEVPQQIFLGTLLQSAVLIAAALTGSAEPGHRGEGSRRVQHLRRSSILDRASARA